jgi:hypothetical protein
MIVMFIFFSVMAPRPKKVLVSVKAAAGKVKAVVSTKRGVVKKAKQPLSVPVSLWLRGTKLTPSEVQQLVTAGADVDECGGDLECPLLVEAALVNNIPLVEALLKAGANPKVRVDYDSYSDDDCGQPLLKACIDGAGGQYDTLETYFFDKKGKVWGATCLPILIKYGAETSDSILTHALNEYFNCDQDHEMMTSFSYDCASDERKLSDYHDGNDAFAAYLVSRSQHRIGEEAPGLLTPTFPLLLTLLVYLYSLHPSPFPAE